MNWQSKKNSNFKSVGQVFYVVFILAILIQLTFAQNGNFRPYNPIQNIFDSIFRPPGNNGPNGPPPRGSRPHPLPHSHPGSPSPKISSKPNEGSGPKNNGQESPNPGNQNNSNGGGSLQDQSSPPQQQQLQNDQQPRLNGSLPPPKHLPPRPTLPRVKSGPPNLRQHPPGQRPHPIRPRPPLPRVGNRNPGGNHRIPLRPPLPHFSNIRPPHLSELQPKDFSGSQPVPPGILNNNNQQNPEDKAQKTSESPESTSASSLSVIDELNRDVPTLSSSDAVDILTGPSLGTIHQTGSVALDIHLNGDHLVGVMNDQVNPFGTPVSLHEENSSKINKDDSREDGSVSPSSLHNVPLDFILRPRGHSGPVHGANVDIAHNHLDDLDSEASQVESDGFFFAKANIENVPLPSALSQKLPRSLDAHDSFHIQDLTLDNASERIDEVLELVDCGGRDLGFCDMSSKYPGHMMGHLMSDCQELVYKGFVPVPEDLDELGDNSPVQKYSNSSKSSVRATEGSWSWKPYKYKKRQICNSELRFIRPGYARDSTGKWQVIVQTEDLPQRVAIDLCHDPGEPCHEMSDCGRKSRCIQRYNFQHLLAVDPENLHSCPTIRAFKFPSACVCHIELSDHF